MKKLVGFLVLCFVIFLAVYRNRIFLRDPIATVIRGGVRQPHTRVLINYSNDVLLEDTSAGRHRLYLVQHWILSLGTPSAPLLCIQGLACMTDADQASEAAVTLGNDAKQAVTMSAREVQFVDTDGTHVEVVLR